MLVSSINSSAVSAKVLPRLLFSSNESLGYTGIPAVMTTSFCLSVSAFVRAVAKACFMSGRSWKSVASSVTKP